MKTVYVDDFVLHSRQHAEHRRAKASLIGLIALIIGSQPPARPARRLTEIMDARAIVSGSRRGTDTRPMGLV